MHQAQGKSEFRLRSRSGFFLAGILLVLPGMLTAGITTSLDSDHPGRNIPSADSSTPAPPAPLPTPPPVMPGWPQMMGVTPPYSPTGVCLADVDASGDLEVIAGSTDNQLYLWDHDGSLRAGWPVNLGGQIQSKAAAADLDGDGDLEIVVAVKSGQVRILHHDGTPLSGWPQSSGLTFGLISPSVYDLFDDGTPEVLLGAVGNLRVWKADGSPLAGWPQSVPGTISGTLAIGDVTGDEIPEIFAVSTSGDLNAFDRNGNPLSGWPVTFGLSSSYAAPSIGDLDGDGVAEVCVVGYTFGVSTQIFAYHGDGNPVPGFPVTYPSDQTYSCPVLGDADGDGDLELFNAGKILDAPTFYAWDHMGDLLPGWPLPAGPNMEGSAVVVDFDAVNGMELAVADNNGGGFIFGYNLDGTVAADFPVPKPGIGGANSPEVGDVDLDGDLDMALTTWNGAVTLWDFPAAYDADEVEWGAYFHDDWNTNQHGFVVPTGGTGVLEQSPFDRMDLGAAFPNPLSERESRVSFSLKQAERVRASVHDIAGREIRRLREADLGPGTHGLVWDGLDATGRPSPSGVYFITLDGSRSGRMSTKVTVLR